MNMSVVIGLCIAAGLVLMGIMLGSPLLVFVDATCLQMVFFGSLALLMQAHGFTGLRTLVDAIKEWFMPSASWSAEEYSHAAVVAQTGGRAAILTGGVAAMIGAVQILHYTDGSNLSTLGPACGVMVLTLFYGLCLKMIVWEPLEVWLTEQAQQKG